MRRRRRVRFTPHDSIPGAYHVTNREGVPLGTLVALGSGQFKVWAGSGFVQSLGRVAGRELGGEILSFHRRATLALVWFEAAGRADYLHESWDGGYR